MNDRNDFIKYDNNGKPERRINLRLTLQGIEFYLRAVKSKQSDCDTDRKSIRDTAEEAERKIDNHVLISRDREGRGRFTFGRITAVVGLILAATAIFVSWLFVTTADGGEIKADACPTVVEVGFHSKNTMIYEEIEGG